MMRKSDRLGTAKSPQGPLWRTTGTAGRFTASPVREEHYSLSPINKQFPIADRRGPRRANASSRRISPVTIQSADSIGHPALRLGGTEHKGNIVTVSSPFQHPCIDPETTLNPINPTRPIAGYIGGKRNLSRQIISLIREIPHSIYAEGFVGMGGIFFRRDQRPKSEVINDWSEDVSTFFRVLQHHYTAFLDMCRFQITSRSGFEKLKALDPASLTDLQRSARFLYLQRLAFGGKVSGRNFGVRPSAPANFDITKLAPMLEAIHERLSCVVIERLPWHEFILRYDRPGTLFYLDPPYFGSENDYGKGMFDRADFARMAMLLRHLKGRFILSINDRPEIRDIFSEFSTTHVETTYHVAGKGRAQRVGELIIKGGG